MEKAILDADVLYVSQKMNGSSTHGGDLAIDIKGLTYLKAPFTGVIKRIYDKCNAVWLESKTQVEYADGTVDYMTVMTLHDNDVSNLALGQTIQQGEIYYQPGTKGYANGSHIHIAAGKGKFTGNGWYKNSLENWCINNQYDITKALFIAPNVKLTNPVYNWKKSNNSDKTIDELAQEVIKGLWENGTSRKEQLTKAGYDYQTIQNRVNEILASSNQAKSTAANTTYATYVVQKGDYLIKIGKMFNKNWREIARDNNIESPWIIKIGQTLIINN